MTLPWGPTLTGSGPHTLSSAVHNRIYRAVNAADLNWDDTAMSGTNVRVTDAWAWTYNYGDIVFQVDWSNGVLPVGDFGIEASVGDAGPWTALTLGAPYHVYDTDVTGSFAIAVTAAQMLAGGYTHARITYTNISGTGDLTDMAGSPNGTDVDTTMTLYLPASPADGAEVFLKEVDELGSGATITTAAGTTNIEFAGVIATSGAMTVGILTRKWDAISAVWWLINYD